MGCCERFRLACVVGSVVLHDCGGDVEGGCNGEFDVHACFSFDVFACECVEGVGHGDGELVIGFSNGDAHVV